MILLISDDQHTIGKIVDDLTQEGFEIEVVEDSDSLNLVGDPAGDYQSILLDFHYRRHDPFKVCERLKSSDRLKFIPLIGIIDKHRLVDQILAFELGADDFIYVPCAALEIQLKMRSLGRVRELQEELRHKDDQLENLKNIQRIMVTLNHYINNALTPLYFAVQLMDDQPADAASGERVRSIARETVEFISKVLQSLHKIVQTGKLQVQRDGVYKDIMFDIEQELNRLMEKTHPEEG